MAFWHVFHSIQLTLHLQHIKLHKPSLNIKEDFFSLSPNARNLVVINLLLSTGLGLGSTFLNIFLWREVQNFHDLIIFYLIQFPIIFSSFLFLGTINYRFKLRTLIQAGFILYILMFALLVVLKEDVFHYLGLLGALNGLAIGVQATGTNTLQYIATKDSNRDRFFALNISQGYAVSLLIPLVAGALLSQTTFFSEITFRYYLLFFLAICFLIAGFIYTLRLSRERLPKMDASEFLSPLKSKIWRFVGIASFIDGFKGGLEGFIGSILLFQILTKELNMGIFNSIFAVISFFLTLYIGKKLSRKNRLTFGLIGALLILFDRIIYVSFFSVDSLIISSLLEVIGVQLFLQGLLSTFFDAIDHTPEHETEYFKYIAFRELPFGSGRILGVLVFLLILPFGKDIEIAKLWYIFIACTPLLYYFLVQKFEKIISSV